MHRSSSFASAPSWSPRRSHRSQGVLSAVAMLVVVFWAARAATAQCGISISGRFGGEVTAVAQINASGLLVARGTWLELLSLANPSAPASFSPPRRIAMDAPAVKIAYSPGSPRAFVLLETGDVTAVTISTSPLLSIGFPTMIYASDVTDILADGQRVYIAERYESLVTISSRIRVVDDTSGTPMFVATIDPFLNNYGFDRLAKVGNILWAGMHELNSSLLGVEGYDVSNPAAPFRVTSSLNNAPLGTNTNVSAMTAIGNELLISYRHDAASTGNEDWLRAVDVTTPGAPFWHPAVDLNGFAGCMSSTGNLLRISIKDSGIGTWDTSNPAALTWLGAYFDTFPVIGQMVAGASTDYWAAGRSGLITMNVSNPASPSVRSAISNLSAGPTKVRQFGNTTAVLDYAYNTLRLFDYTLPEDQQLRSSIFLPYYAELLELGNLSGGAQVLACVATQVPGAGDSITIYDITNPAAPTTRATITGFEARLMSVTGSRMYVLTSANEFKIIELSQQPPAIRSTMPFGGVPSDYTCMTSWESGATKAVALGTDPFGLWLIDTTNGVTPFVASVYNPGGSYRGIRALAKGQNYLYVSALVANPPSIYEFPYLESISITSLTSPTRRWLTTYGLGTYFISPFDSLSYISSPAGKFLVGTAPNSYDDAPDDTQLVLFELPGGFLTNEGVPFRVIDERLARSGGAGNIVPNPDGSRIIVNGGPAGLYQIAMPVQWPPGFGLQPTDQSACYLGSATFTAIASGNPTAITYQWYRYPPNGGFGTPLADGTAPWGTTIAGATDFSITISNIHAPDLGIYLCVATNSCGNSSSTFAQLRFCPGDFNCSGAATVQDIFDFLTAFFAGDPHADFNGAGGITVQDLFDFLAAFFTVCH